MPENCVPTYRYHSYNITSWSNPQSGLTQGFPNSLSCGHMAYIDYINMNKCSNIFEEKYCLYIHFHLFVNRHKIYTQKSCIIQNNLCLFDIHVFTIMYCIIYIMFKFFVMSIFWAQVEIIKQQYPIFMKKFYTQI